MSTRRKEAFDQFWGSFIQTGKFSGGPSQSDCWMAWQAAAILYDRYPQFPGEGDCEQRLHALEIKKDKSFNSKIKALESRLHEALLHVAIRKEVHRDDYLRSGILVHALKQIMDKSTEPDIAELARSTIVEVWGTSPTKHCDRHGSYTPSCPECRMVGKSKAREQQQEGLELEEID